MSLNILCFNKQIQNDSTCPNCRIYHVSLHKNQIDAFKTIAKSDKDAKMIECNQISMFKVEAGVTYPLESKEIENRFNHDDSDSIDYYDSDSDSDYYSEEDTDTKFESMDLNYMLLLIEIDKTEKCLYNTRYSVSFHPNKKKIYKKVANMLETIGTSEKKDFENEKPLRLKIKASGRNKDKIIKRHYQIIKLTSDEQICLNDYLKEK